MFASNNRPKFGAERWIRIRDILRLATEIQDVRRHFGGPMLREYGYCRVADMSKKQLRAELADWIELGYYPIEDQEGVGA
jgi:hypothetical protein